MPSEEMLKQLLDEFVEKEALVCEELKFVEEQVEQLEEKLAACRARMAALAIDKEKVAILKNRYSEGRFYQRGMQFSDADIAAFKTREGGQAREAEDGQTTTCAEAPVAAPAETTVSETSQPSDNAQNPGVHVPEPAAVTEEVVSLVESVSEDPDSVALAGEAPVAEASVIESAASEAQPLESAAEPPAPPAEITPVKGRGKAEAQSSKRAARNAEKPAAPVEEPDALASVLSGMALGGGEPKTAKGAAIAPQEEVQANSLEPSKTENAKAQEPAPTPDLATSPAAEAGNAQDDAQASEPNSSLLSATQRSTRVSSGGIKSILGLRRAIATPPPPAPTLSPWEAAEAEAAARAANSPSAPAGGAAETGILAPASEPIQAGEAESQSSSAQDAFAAVMNGPLEQASDSAPSQADALIDQLELEMQGQVQAVAPAVSAQDPSPVQEQAPQAEDSGAGAVSDSDKQESSEESDGDSDTVKSINDALRSLFR